MVLKTKDFVAAGWQKPSLNTKVEEEKIKKTRRLIMLVFFLLINTVSAVLYFKPKLVNWKGEILKPVTYQIISSRNDADNLQLQETLGFKPGLDNPQELKDSLETLLTDLTGIYGVYLVIIETGQEIGLNENEVYTAASVIKVPVMVNFYQEVEAGNFDEDEVYTLKRADIQNYGTGVLRYQAPGSTYTLAKLAELSGKKSDNTAAWILQSKIGTRKIQERLTDLDMDKTSLKENTTTPKQMGDYFILLFKNKLVSQDSKEKIFSFLTNTDFEDRIPAGVPDGTRVAHKIGNEIQTYNDCGIVFNSSPYLLCILSKEVKETEALEVLPKISKLVWSFVTANN